ncbi:protein rep [Bacillus sp. 2SH]|uniref:protein rep n=1 Tax=Bacillus sp. 2SH TaxID=2502202 RepID=UPI0010F69D93|nr:protein rep [Bacillus sp. 2SH]
MFNTKLSHINPSTNEQKWQVNILKDETKDGKIRPWKKKKENNLKMASSYLDASIRNKAVRVYQCARVLQFQVTPQGKKLAHAWFCKVRLCPMCNWRRSIKIANQNREIILRANKEEKLKWLFLTLTTGETVEGKDLKKRINHSMEAFNRFMKYKRIQHVIRGYFRGLEVTKNKNRYHPHFHVLLAVKPSYFNNLYITQKDWAKLWKKAMQSSSDIIVDVRTVKPNKKHSILTETKIQAFEGALQEVSKYPVKDIEILKGNRQENAVTVYTLDNALSHKRLIGYGGILKDIRKKLQLEDCEDEHANLIYLDENCEDTVASEIEMITAYWHYGLKEYIVKNNNIHNKERV